MLRPCASSLRALARTSNAVSVPISSMRRANFMPLSSHAERTEVALVGRPVDANILDASHARAMAELVEEMLERSGLPLRFHLHGAIEAIADVALEPQLAGVPLGEKAKADTLNVAYNLRLEPAP